MDDLRTLPHGTYWGVAAGQLEFDEEVHHGFKTKVEAEEVATSVTSACNVEVRLLNTHEHHLPYDDPEFDPNEVFDSKRWCPVVSKKVD